MKKFQIWIPFAIFMAVTSFLKCMNDRIDPVQLGKNIGNYIIHRN